MGTNLNESIAPPAPVLPQSDTTPDQDRTGPYAGSAPDPVASPAPPDFEISGELGRGGMGVVYKARQVSLNRPCALKMILAGGHASESERRRFLAEGEAVATLNHPNIVQVYQSGTHGGLPWFALEYCGGGSLARRLDGKPLPPVEAARLVEQLARAVQAAHSAGIIHRDLKPANVLLADDGTPRVADFGLARRADSDGPTASGAVMGTPSYMAPEQAGGHSREAGPAADVWALGAILHECLAGKPPFRGSSVAETLLKVLNDDPTPPPGPRDLVTICLKCLQKEPARRYASADALAEDLRRWHAGEPILARPVGPFERFWLWARRRPGIAGLVFLLIASISVGVTLSIRFGMQSAEDARRAKEALAEVEISLADGLLRPLGHFDHDRPLAEPEIEALNELAALPTGRERVRRQFVIRAWDRPRSMTQISRRLQPSLHAAVGFDRRMAEEIIGEAYGRLDNPSTPIGHRLPLARAIAFLDVREGQKALVAADALVSVVATGIGSSEGQEVVDLLEAILPRLPSGKVRPLLDTVLARLDVSGDEDTRLLVVPVLIRGLPTTERSPVARAITGNLLRNLEYAPGLYYSGSSRKAKVKCIRGLLHWLSPEEIGEAALHLLSMLPPDDPPNSLLDGLRDLTEVGNALPVKLKPAACNRLSASVLIYGKPEDQVTLVRCLPLIASLPGDQAIFTRVASAFAARADAMIRSTPPGEGRKFAFEILSEAARYLSPEEAGRRLGDLARYLGEESDTTCLKDLVVCHAHLVARAPKSACLERAMPLAEIVAGKLPEGKHRWVGAMITQVLERLPEHDGKLAARTALAGLLKQLVPHPDTVLGFEVRDLLPVLLARIPRAEATNAANRLADIATRHPESDIPSAYAQPVASYLSVAVAEKLALALRRSMSKAELSHLTELTASLAAISSLLDEGRAGALADLLAALRRDPTMSAGRQASASLARDPETAWKAMEAFNEAARPGKDVVSVIAFLESATPLSASVTARARVPLIEAACEATMRANPHARPTHADYVAAVLAFAGPEHPDTRGAIDAFALAHIEANRGMGTESAPLLSRLSTEGIRRVLRHPCCVGTTRRHALAECSRRAGRQMAALWDAVDWLEGANP